MEAQPRTLQVRFDDMFLNWGETIFMAIALCGLCLGLPVMIMIITYMHGGFELMARAMLVYTIGMLIALVIGVIHFGNLRARKARAEAAAIEAQKSAKVGGRIAAVAS